MNISLFQLKDILVLPVLFLLVYRIAHYVKSNYYKNSEIGKFMMPALVIRMVFTILLAALVEYYYKGGDLFSYFRHATMLNSMFVEHPEYAIKILLNAYESLPTEIQVLFPNDYTYRYAGSTEYIPRIALPFTVLSMGSYWGAAFAFTTFSYIGSWKLFKMFYELYPHLKNQLAISILFLPSVCFWCTGTLKDPLSFGGVTLFIYSAYMVFIKREKITFYILIGIFSMALVFLIKSYIILSALPCVFIWVFMEVKSIIKRSQRKIFYAISYVTIPIIIAVLYIGIQGNFATERYASEKVLDEIQKQQENFENVETQNSFVSVEKFDGTFLGLIKKIPSSVSLVLFRPFLWEVSSVMMLFSALESLFLLCLTMLVLWKYKFNFVDIIRKIVNSPLLVFSILFTLVLAVVVGISTLNFGTLSRYRVPVLPFYAVSIFLLIDAKRKIGQRNGKLK